MALATGVQTPALAAAGRGRPGRWAWAEIDSDALRHNVALTAALVAPSGVWAVVKADGYGHGALVAAHAAIAGGATGLCVALVQEGVELRRGGVEAPILVLSPQPAEQADEMIAHRLTPTVTTPAGVAAIAAAVRRTGPAERRVGVHIKVDTGMHRVGVRPGEVGDLIALVEAPGSGLRLAGLFTHLAAADAPEHPANAAQLDAFDLLVSRHAGGLATGHDERSEMVVHAANSAAAAFFPRARRSFVRLGIAMYGVTPGPAVVGWEAAREWAVALRPVLSLRARVSHVQVVADGGGVSYGHQYRVSSDRLIATVPIGYADGVPRRLFHAGGEVLLGGRRLPIAGVVTMDQLMLDCGPASAPDVAVSIGDEVVLLGRQGDEEIRAEEWAERLGTIAYEIVCGISRRVPRIVTRSTPSA